MAGFKYPLEQALIVGCSSGEMLEPSDLYDDGLASALSEARLYLIAHRPRLIVHDARPDAEGGPVFSIGTIDGQDGVEWQVPGDHLVEVARHDEVRLRTRGEVSFRGRASRLIQDGLINARQPMQEEELAFLHQLLDLQVLYVGKSDDVRGVIRGRLRTHSTLQRILAEFGDKHSDREIWVLPLVFDQYSTIGVITPDSAQFDDASFASRVAGMRPNLSDGAITALAEAAMIRYFKPPRNTKLLGSFPSKTHRPYQEVFPYDYNSLGFRLDLHSIGVAVGTETVEPSFSHEYMQPVDRPAERAPLTVESILNSLGRPQE